MNVHLKALGCRLNEAELETWAQGFRLKGYGLTESPEEADILVLNTCAVTQDAMRKSARLMRRLHRENPSAKLVVTGCDATVRPEEAERSLGVDLVVPNVDKDRLVEIATRRFTLPVLPPLTSDPAFTPLFARSRQRAFVKVQDGCRYRCTFCIVTVARGEERSRPLAEIVDEINHLHRMQGVQEIVLTGVHVGGYGSDLGLSLYGLVHAILANTDIPRLRLASVEPWDLPENFFSLFENNRLMPHMHLALQSGSDRVLRRMARRCKTECFERLVEQARSQVLDFNVTTDIIVGFPGETQADWDAGLAFIERVGFGHLHIFRYSRREGTKAAQLPNQIPPEIKKKRSRQIQALGLKMKRATLTRNVGKTVPLLLEGRGYPQPSGSMRYWGYTPNFLRVAIETPSGADLKDRIRPARLLSVDASSEYAWGQLV